MTDVKTWVPTGLFEERDPIVSERLVRLFERTGGRRAAPQRIVAHQVAGAKPAEVEAFLARHPAWRARLRLPGLFELYAQPKDIDAIADRADIFSFIDAAGRLTGPAVPSPSASVAIRIVKKGGKETRKKVPAREIADLLKAEDVEAIDVEGVG